LVRLAYPGAGEGIAETLAKDYFVDSLEDKELRWRVYQSKARNLDEAICAAVEMEAYNKAEVQRNLPKRFVRELKISGEPNDVQNARDDGDIRNLQRQIDELVKMISRLGKDKMPGQMLPKPNVVCWGCGEEGHYRSRCQKTKTSTFGHRMSSN
jgi:6-phosphogluconolactonase/glucosamine-6-phosphate isomerase/deaminase